MSLKMREGGGFLRNRQPSEVSFLSLGFEMSANIKSAFADFLKSCKVMIAKADHQFSISIEFFHPLLPSVTS